MESDIRHLPETDCRKAAEALARSFRNDPGCLFVFSTPERCEKGMRRIFRSWLRVMAAHKACWTVPDCSGVAVWYSSAAKPALACAALFQTGLWRLPLYMTPAEQYRGIRFFRDLKKRTENEETEEHWVLDTLGVAPEAQGKGIASALVRQGLQHADKAGKPARVITHNPANVPFYRQFGFEPVESGCIAGTEVQVIVMRRKVSDTVCC